MKALPTCFPLQFVSPLLWLRSLAFCLLYSCLPLLVHAQQSEQGESRIRSLYNNLHIDLALDALPFLARGYGGSLALGMRMYRLRIDYGHLRIPKAFLPSFLGFSQLRRQSLQLDFFFEKEFRAWWVGAGFEQWKQYGNVASSTEAYEYRSTLFSCSAGYQWYFYKGFYLSPLLALHILLSSSRELRIEDEIYKPPLLLPQLSLRLGYRF